MTTPPSSLPPANWYPDPQTPGQLRYWDGQRWTQHVHPAQQPAQGVGGAGTVQPQAGPGVFLPSGRPGSAQPAQGAGPAQGTFNPTPGAGPAQGTFTPGQGASPAQGTFNPVQGASPAQGTFTPTPGPATGAQPQAQFNPTGGGPTTGAQPLAQSAPGAVGPGTGSLRTFQPGGAGVQAPLQAGAPAGSGFDVETIPRGGGASGTYDVADSSGTSRQAGYALVFTLLALLTTGLSIYGLDTGYDAYVTYAAGAVGFVSVFFGFAGLGKSLQGEGGRGRSILAVAMGFLAIGLNTYEYLNPRELYDIIAGLF